jgi:hypothetical protein
MTGSADASGCSKIQGLTDFTNNKSKTLWMGGGLLSPLQAFESSLEIHAVTTVAGRNISC